MADQWLSTDTSGVGATNSASPWLSTDDTGFGALIPTPSQPVSYGFNDPKFKALSSDQQDQVVKDEMERFKQDHPIIYGALSLLKGDPQIPLAPPLANVPGEATPEFGHYLTAAIKGAMGEGGKDLAIGAAKTGAGAATSKLGVPAEIGVGWPLVRSGTRQMLQGAKSAVQGGRNAIADLRTPPSINFVNPEEVGIHGGVEGTPMNGPPPLSAPAHPPFASTKPFSPATAARQSTAATGTLAEGVPNGPPPLHPVLNTDQKMALALKLKQEMEASGTIPLGDSLK